MSKPVPDISHKRNLVIAEMARRELINRDLLEHVRFFWRDQNLKLNWFHRQLADTIMDAIKESQEKNTRIHLTISCPPRHSKSLFTTRGLTSWFIGRFPHKQALVANATSTLADDFGREIRNVMNDPEYQAIFPHATPSLESNATDHLNTVMGGGYSLGGTGVMWNGKGGSCIILDDPIKDREQAESKGEMDKMWTWFNSTLMARRAPACVTIVMHTRWAIGDLIGRIKSTDKKGIWRHFNFPQLAEEDEPHRKKGETLIPEWISTQAAAEERDRLIDTGCERDWLAVYQQRPTKDSGDFFKSEYIDFQPLATYPKKEDLTWYIGADFAASTKNTADRTALVPIGVDEKGDLWFASNPHWERTTTLDSVEKLIDLVKEYKPVKVIGEKGPLQAAIMPILKKRMQERSAYFSIEEIARSQAKYVYAAPLQARMQQHKVHFPDNSFYKLHAVPQFLNFTPGVDGEDDFIDASSMVALILDRLHNFQKEAPPKEKTPQEEDDETWDRIMKHSRPLIGSTFRKFNGDEIKRR